MRPCRHTQPASVMLIVSHDAGGAEIISSWIRRQPRQSALFVLEGPAVAIFQRKLPGLQIKDAEELKNAIHATDWVLTGTSWNSDLEKRAISVAKRAGIRVSSYLDHWTDYSLRFACEGTLVLPDEIWVGDEYAQKAATVEFPDTPVSLVPNVYLAEIVADIAGRQVSRPPGAPVRVLYVSEPTSLVADKKHGDPRHWGYTEFEALDGFLRYLESTPSNVEAIRLRAHPAEPRGKYAEVILPFRAQFAIEESAGESLVEDCVWADWVVGCDSMAMVVALYAGKQVFCAIPTGGKPPSLPFPNIVRLFLP